jgi:hypothetical protein
VANRWKGESKAIPAIAKLYWDARFLLGYMYPNGRPLEEEEEEEEELSL